MAPLCVFRNRLIGLRLLIAVVIGSFSGFMSSREEWVAFQPGGDFVTWGFRAAQDIPTTEKTSIKLFDEQNHCKISQII
jgi:hypothetical protein